MERDGHSIEAGEKKGREPPEWYVNAPELLPGDDFYLVAFWALGSCRPVGFGPAPIPWTAVAQYGIHAGLERDMLEAFSVIIGEMDAAYLSWASKEADKHRSTKGQAGTEPVAVLEKG